jgi:hypothetical protein
MNKYLNKGLCAAALLLLALGLWGCEIDTDAYGTVKDSDTGAPVVGAHVMEIAVYKKSQQLMCESYTDSTGSFEMTAGLSGFGPQKVNLQVVVEKDSFLTTVVDNNYGALDIRIKHY